MGVEEFASITIREFFNKMRGAYDHNRYLQLEDWQRARFIATQIWNVQLEPGKRLTEQQLLLLPGEEGEVAESKSTRERFEEFCKQHSIPFSQ